MDLPPTPERFAETVIALPLHCRKCGYTLRGLPVIGKCPECGLDVWATVVHTVDPTASTLPRLRSPRAVGDAMLWLMLCLLLSAVLLVLRPLAIFADRLDLGSVDPFSRLVPAYGPAFAALPALLGLIAVRYFAPPRGGARDGPVWRGVRLIIFGLVGWALLALGRGALGQVSVMADPPAIFADEASVRTGLDIGLAAAGTFILAGLHHVLSIIGLRSREYRTSRSGRQGLMAMILAVVGIVAGRVLVTWTDTPRVQEIGRLVTASLTFMLLIGLAYMVMNAWWIRRALRREPPSLAAVIRKP